LGKEEGDKEKKTVKENIITYETEKEKLEQL